MLEYTVYAAIILIVGFVVYGFMTHYSDEFGRTVVLMFLILSTVVFWALFEQSAGSMTLFADRVVDREVGGVTFTAAQFGSLNAGFIMLLALPFAGSGCGSQNATSSPRRRSSSVSASCRPVWVSARWSSVRTFPTMPGRLGMIWLVLAYLLHTTGELCLSPVGLSAVTKLSIGSVVGVSMGTWFLATALVGNCCNPTRQDGGDRHARW